MIALVRRLARDRGRLCTVVAMIAAAVIYAPTLGRGLVNLDDPWLVRDNWIVRDASWSSLHHVFFDLDTTHRYVLGAEYLPVRDLSVMLDHALWGDWYGGHHLVNVALYIASIPLWFAALVRLGIERTTCGLALLLWAVHPSHAESVAWLAERKGVLGMMFAGACALAYARFRAGHGARWLSAAVGFAVCAVWSKALAAFAIAALGGLELVAPAARVSWRRSGLGLGAIAIAAGLAFVPVLWTARAMAVIGVEAHTSVNGAAMAVGTFGFDVRLGLGVIDNAIAYPFTGDGPALADYLLGAVGLISCLVAFAARAGTWRAPARIGATIWLVGWFPVSQLVLPLQQVVVADRYVLFPTLGLAVALAFGLTRIASTRIRAAAVVAIALTFSVRAFVAQLSWRDSSALWERAVASNPHDGNAWSMYAEALDERGDHEAAVRAVGDGLASAPTPRLTHRAALQALAAGDRPRALRLLREAAAGGEPSAMTNLALQLIDSDREAALEWARRAVATHPTYANGFRILGKVALADGRNAEALDAYTSAYALEPTVFANRFNLALALVALHRPSEARAHLDACLADPLLAPRARALLESLDQR